jgi:RNA polymerase sigma factor (sigma-70 family)
MWGLCTARIYSREYFAGLKGIKKGVADSCDGRTMMLGTEITCARAAEIRGTVKEPARLRRFEEIALPHMNAAYNLARWLTRNEHDAQDVVQESYLRAFRYFDSYQGGDGKAWLLAVVRNTHLTWRSRVKSRLEIELDEEGEQSARNAQSEEANALERMVTDAGARDLRGCIEELPLDYRGVLVMRELEELSYQQISEVASLPIGTVMSRLSRARARLAECVKARAKGRTR